MLENALVNKNKSADYKDMTGQLEQGADLLHPKKDHDEPLLFFDK